MQELFFKLSVKFEFGAEQRDKLYEKLSQLLRNGVSLDRALEQIAFVSGQRRGTMLPELLNRWRRSVANGINFGRCIAPYVSASEAMLIEAGANSGFLQQSLDNAAEAVRQQRRVKKAIVGGAAYPVMLLALLIAALMVASYQMIPTFDEVLPVEEWTGISKVVADVTFFIRDQGLYILGGVVGFVALVWWSLPRWVGKTRLWVENIVPYNLYRMWQGSALLLSIASLMSAGVKIDDQALNRIASKAPPYLNERIQAIKRLLSSGFNLGEAFFKTGMDFPDPELVADLRIYATLKGFENNIVTITKEWVSGIEEQVKTAMKVANSMVLLLIAITIGSLVSALFGVVQQIQSSTQF
jgi:type II secretory pathway component PulF